MKWFTSDQHYHHENVISYCQRPFKSIEEMNAELISRYNVVVGDSDTCFFLGDFAFGGIQKRKDILGQLKGTKILVRGNHDGDFKDCEKLGFHFVVDRAVVKLGKKSVQLSHFPYQGSNIDDRYPEKHPQKFGKYLLHGHVHQHWKVKDGMINVGVDVWDFQPVSEQVIHQVFDTFVPAAPKPFKFPIVP